MRISYYISISYYTLRIQTEIADLCAKLDACKKESKVSNEALVAENAILNNTCKTAEVALDDLGIRLLYLYIYIYHA